MNASIQRTLAKKAGIGFDGSWLELYDYHLGAVESPLPFEVWKRKYILLSKMTTPSATGQYHGSEKEMLRISEELGV